MLFGRTLSRKVEMFDPRRPRVLHLPESRTHRNSGSAAQRPVWTPHCQCSRSQAPARSQRCRPDIRKAASEKDPLARVLTGPVGSVESCYLAVMARQFAGSLSDRASHCHDLVGGGCAAWGTFTWSILHLSPSGTWRPLRSFNHAAPGRPRRVLMVVSTRAGDLGESGSGHRSATDD